MNNNIKFFLGLVLTCSLLNTSANCLNKNPNSLLKTWSYLDPSGNEFNNPLVNDLETKFNGLSTLPYLFFAHVDGVISDYRYMVSENNPDFLANHFQGMSRLPKQLNLENYIVVSGGNLPDMQSELFIIKENPFIEHLPPFFQYLKWEFKEKVVLNNSGYWHAGGIQATGKYLIVPLESTDYSTFWNSKIVFYDMSDPENPQKLSVEIDRPNESAGAAALTRLDDGHFIVAIWTDADQSPSRFDFYRSIDTTLESGFTRIAQINKTGVKYQTIQFILDSNGTPYIIGAQNTLELLGSNTADLLEVTYLNSNVTDVSTKYTKYFLCSLSNFHAGACIYTPDSDNICLYSLGHFLLTLACKSVSVPTKLCFDEFGPATFF